MGRKQPDTSRLSYEKIMRPGARESMYTKIILCLEWKMDATSYEIAAWAKVKPDKIWKRCAELRRDDVIFDTKLRRNSPDGNPSMVYALSTRKSEYSHVIAPERHNSNEMSASDWASKILAGTKQGKLKQQELFKEEK